jgi:membrane fusion protein, multidrug efflux system
MINTVRKITAYASASILFAMTSGCHKSSDHSGEHHAEHHRIIATSPLSKEVTITQQYVCQIHSCRHIEVRALEGGYLDEIPVKEGQSVQQGELMFKILPTLYQATLDSEVAEAQLAQIEFNNTQKLFQQKVVSQQEVALAQAKLAKAQAELKLAKAEVNFTDVKAPFNGIIDRLMNQQGSLIEEGDILTTLSDNSVMWVYFNVPEASYLEYKATVDSAEQAQLDIELKLANGNIFSQPGKIGAIEADFNSQTGNIAFRADFENPLRLLRRGQTGTILIKRKLADAIVIPQRATFEVLDKKFVYVLEEGVVRQRTIHIDHELDDIYVIKDGLKADDKIVLDGILQVRDGDKTEFEFKAPEEILGGLKNRAE